MIYFGVLILCIFLLYYQQSKKEREQLLLQIRESWGKKSRQEINEEEMKRIKSYYSYHYQAADNIIDDITWNDLELDQVFQELNQTYSSAGEEYLYWLLRTPAEQQDILDKREHLILFFQNHEKEREQFQLIFHRIGKNRIRSISEVIAELSGLNRRSNLPHYCMLGILILSGSSLLLYPAIGIFSLLIAMGISGYHYYREKAFCNSYLSCFCQLTRMLSAIKELERKPALDLKEYNEKLSQIRKKLYSFERGNWIFASQNLTGSFFDLFLDYIRIVTHIDLIKFNNMVNIFKKNQKEIEEMFCLLGLLESMIAVASFRKAVPYYAVPEFTKVNNASLFIEKGYHPIMEYPVANSLCEEHNMLITGSNASGKSTFLKMAAINAIFSQTIATVCAERYQGDFFRIYSSMALRDSLKTNESYYVREIKSLKRILDAVREKRKVLCLIDEVLRGTNTIERIAASSQILNSLNKTNVFCIAATHDIELTYMLEESYHNYHFQEEIKEDEILFSYQLLKGRAVSRNAIKLLEVLGYDNKIIDRAKESANRFVEKGMWKI